MRKQRYRIFLGLLLIAGTYFIIHYRVLSVSTQQDVKIIVVLKSMNFRSDFWQTVSAGAQAAAREVGLYIEVQGPLQDTDADKQILILEEIIKQKPDAIVLAPYLHERMPGIINQIREADINLVVIDTPLDINPQAVHVFNDHVEAGRRAGETAIHLNIQYPNVTIISDYKSSKVSAYRLEGLRLALSSHPQQGPYYIENSEETAYEVAKKVIMQDPLVNTFITMNESSMLGAARALKEQHKADQIKLIGFDSSIYAIQLLEDGTLAASIVQKPFNMGYLGVKAALKLIEGTYTEQSNDIEPNVITRENMYSPENQKLLFPFIDNK
jgi:ribose transport system substrate-binding protein